ncbi:hypothetical protein GJAV_G00250850 [Gymnothorax javanicus]|nr:hypothetical protein GJAV_G00250850 [Gymnothorax javanicus]
MVALPAKSCTVLTAISVKRSAGAAVGADRSCVLEEASLSGEVKRLQNKRNAEDLAVTEADREQAAAMLTELRAVCETEKHRLVNER